MSIDPSLALWLSPGVMAVFGLCIGSFLNVVIHRLPRMMERDWWSDIAAQLGEPESWLRVFGGAAPPEAPAASRAIEAALAPLPAMNLVRPGSRCPACGHHIRWYENLPLVGWLLLRGRCSACKAPISIRYPAVEVATGALFAACAWQFGPQPVMLAWCAVVALLLAMALIDWDTTYLPDVMTQPLLWGGVLASALGWTIPINDAILGATVGYLSLWSIYWLFKLTTGKEGMGAGDFKLLGALGAWLGWHAILPIALMSSIVGVAIALPMKFGGRLKTDHQIPFGPFLAGGGLVVIFVGADRCLEWIGVH